MDEIDRAPDSVVVAKDPRASAVHLALRLLVPAEDADTHGRITSGRTARGELGSAVTARKKSTPYGSLAPGLQFA